MNSPFGEKLISIRYKVLNKIATVVASYPKQLVVILCFVAGNFVEAGRMGEGKGEEG